MLKKNKKLLIGAIVALIIVAVITATAVLALANPKTGAILSAIVNGDNYSQENDLNGDGKVDVLDAMIAVRQGKFADSKLNAEYELKNGVISRLTTPVEVCIDNITDTGNKITLNYLAWPTVVKGEDGTLYAGASLRRSHIDPFGAIAFFESTDNGKNWSEPTIIYDSPVDDRDVGLVYLGGGKMVATFFTLGSDYFLEEKNASDWNCNDTQKKAKLASWENLDPEYSVQRRYVMTSDNYGQTWEGPFSVDFSSPHGPSLMNDGKTLIAPGLNPDNSREFSTYISTDYGKTWTENSKVTLPTNPGHYYSEPYVIQLSDGSFLAGIRSEKSGTTDYSSYSIWTMKSRDGKNWTEARQIPGVVGAPAHFLELSNGAILLTYSYRVNPYRCVKGCISYDGGMTWDNANELEIGEHIYYTGEESDKTDYNVSDLGYPSTVQLDDGTLITVYYQAYNRYDSHTSLLYTKWKLK